MTMKTDSTAGRVKVRACSESDCARSRKVTRARRVYRVQPRVSSREGTMEDQSSWTAAIFGGQKIRTSGSAWLPFAFTLFFIHAHGSLPLSKKRPGNRALLVTRIPRKIEKDSCYASESEGSLLISLKFMEYFGCNSCENISLSIVDLYYSG